MNKNKVLNYVDPPNGFGDQCINAFIQAGFSFFTALAGIGATGIANDWKTALVAAFVAGGLGFFGSLIAQRSLKAPKPE